MVRLMQRFTVGYLLSVIWVAVLFAPANAQPAMLDYQVDADFFKLPEGWNFGPTPGAVQRDDGNILIFTRGEHALLEFTSSGQFVRELAHGQFETPHGLRLDADGNIWTTDVASNLVIKFDPNGRKQMVLGLRGLSGVVYDTLGLYGRLFDKPTDIAFDSKGDVYISDGYGNFRVVKYTADGEYVTEWGERGTEPGQFDLPHSIFVDSRDRVWVADRNNSRIQVFDSDGNVLEVWDHLGTPWGFAAASDGNVWVADGSNDRVAKVTLDGEMLGTFGEPGRAPGKLGWAHFLTELADGSIVVAEIVSHRPQRFVMGQ